MTSMAAVALCNTLLTFNASMTILLSAQPGPPQERWGPLAALAALAAPGLLQTYAQIL